MERNPTILVGRGSGITHQFEQSRLLGYFVERCRAVFVP